MLLFLNSSYVVTITLLVDDSTPAQVSHSFNGWIRPIFNRMRSALADEVVPVPEAFARSSSELPYW